METLIWDIPNSRCFTSPCAPPGGLAPGWPKWVARSRQALEEPLVIDVRDPNEVVEGKGGPPSAIPGSVAWKKPGSRGVGDV